MYLVKKLNGHSGCDISLFKTDSNELFVRKSSASLDYNVRLIKQIAKQKSFKTFDQKIFAPKILNTSLLERQKLAYYYMEYAQATVLSEYIKTVRMSEIGEFSNYFFLYLATIPQKTNPNTQKIFEKKILSLKNPLKSKFKRLTIAFRTLLDTDWSEVPESSCHGDLTLENILVTKDKKFYLIDFLDSFFNSWMIDFAKLYQDLILGFSYRHQKLNANSKLRILVAKESITERLLSTPGGEKNLLLIYKILLLNVLRIGPYVKDDVTRHFVDNSIKIILKLINDR